MTHTVTILDQPFAIATEAIRVITASYKAGRAPAMLVACLKCETVCSGGYTDAALTIPCVCCRRINDARRRGSASDFSRRPHGLDFAQHVRAPLADAMRTLASTAA